VRLAEEGEQITTLDGVERELTSEDLLICDADRAPQAIAGVMGGSTAEVSDSTSEILLESAYFERMGIAKTSKRLKLRSESSARFERGIDPDAVARNAERAMELLVEVAAARVAPESQDVYPNPVDRQHITVRTSRVNHVLGTELDAEEVWDALAPLGIDLDDGGDRDTLVATVPTFRPDLEREIDLVEEVARRIGFDHIGRTVPRASGQIGGLTQLQRDRRAVADALVGFGCSEAITLSLVSPAGLARAGAPVDRLVRASNPLRAEESVLRTRVLPGLLQGVAFNRSHGLHDVALFEQGHVFFTPAGDAGPLPEEPEHLAVAMAGTVRRRPVEDDRPVDVYDAVDALRAVVDALEIETFVLEPADIAGFRPGRSARVLAGGADVGTVGEVAESVVDALGLERPVVAFEVVLDALVAAPRRDRQFGSPSRFPASSIDLAFVVADTVPADAIARTLREAAGTRLEDVRPFDVFQSDALGAGRRSIAFSLRFRAPDRTLTDAEIADLRQRAIDAVIAAHGAELRA
jgi:phenylalanyl-tRNA synthetase beta chain